MTFRLPVEIQRAPFVVGGRGPAGIDCYGVTLVVAAELGLDLVDPWVQLERDYAAGIGANGNGMPPGWQRIAVESRSRDGDLWIWTGPFLAVGMIAGGRLHTAMRGIGVVSIDPWRAPAPAEVWRPPVLERGSRRQSE